MKKTLLTLVLLSTLSSIGQVLPRSVYSSQQWDEESPKFDVLSMNYGYLTDVQQFKKIEFGVDIHGELLDRINAFIHTIDSVENPLNPFLEWDVKITASFQLDGTKIVKKRDGFFYQDYTIDEEDNDWDLANKNPYPFRIRFAPPKSGVWNTRILISYDDKGERETITLPPFKFTVVKNDHPGYISVHDNKRNLKRGGKVIFPIGHNMAGPYNNVDTYGGDPSTTNKRAEVDDWQSFRKDIEGYVEKGGKFIKLIQLPYSSLLEFEERGNYFNRLHYAWEQDKILDYCEKNDVLIHFNLFFQNPIMKVSQYNRTIFDFGHWDGTKKINIRDKFRPYCYYTREGKEPHEMFLDSLDLEYHKQRTRYYVARYGYSPQIYNFEILSEPWHLDAMFDNPNYHSTGLNEGKWIAPFEDPEHPDFEIVHKALVSYHNTIASYIKNDLEDKEHLIGITILSKGAAWPWGHEDITLDKSVFLDNIDLIGVNRYEATPDKLIAYKNSKNNETPLGENSFYHLVKRLHDMCDKPVILSEAGSDGCCEKTVTHKIDVMTLGFSGVAGAHMWLGYRHGKGRFDERTLWQSTIHSQNHMNKEVISNTLSGNWIQGRQIVFMKGHKAKTAKEIQYYIAEDKMSSIGYVKNRSYNDLTTSGNCKMEYPAPWNKLQDMNYKKHGKLTIEGLKKGRYLMVWYNYATDGELERKIVKVKGSGKLKKVPHPELTVTEGKALNPLLWFSLQKCED